MIDRVSFTAVGMFICLCLFFPLRMCEAGTGAVSAGSKAAYARATDDPTPPDEPVKLIFIHHSCGQNWLDDGNGGLGLEVRDNNYFLSDVNYGWGPDGIGDNTDIGHWWNWFRGGSSTTYMNALSTEYGQHCSYSRLASDPGGQNEIIMFKSCYPNSNLAGNPGDPPTAGSNPLRGQDCYSGDHTVANAKGIYNDLLDYFATRQDKLFIVITAPPVQDGTYAANARAFNTWLAEDWLDDAGYTYNNVAVFDFYTVLTSNGGNWYTNDLDWGTGNHHRYRAGAVQHITTQGGNTAAYPDGGGDNHPSAAGNQKATAEFVPLLNIFYHRWHTAPEPCSMTLSSLNGSGTWCAGQTVAITWSSENSSGTVDIDYSTSGGSTWHDVVKSTADDGSYSWTIPDEPSDYCLVRVCDAADGDCCDQSAAFFAICDSPRAAFSGTPVHDEGETCVVTFTDQSSGCVTGWTWTFGDGGSSDQQHPHHVYECGDSYTVQLTVSGPCGTDVETKTGYITCECHCRMSLVSPAGGETWCAGESRDIEWTSEYTGGTVHIDYSTDGGGHWQTISAGTPDDGSFPWNIPDSPSTTCLVRIRDAADSTCGDTGQDPFQICSCDGMAILTDSLFPGTEGCPLDQPIEVSGGCSPYAWSISSGDLPSGVSLNESSGRLSGSPGESGLFSFSVQVRDGLGDISVSAFTFDIAEYVAVKGDVDVNCSVNILDVITVINFILGVNQPTPEEEWCADCNGPPGDCGGDGTINILDALKVVTILLGADHCP